MRPPPPPHLADVIGLVLPARLGKPFDHGVGVGRIVERLDRQALQLVEELDVGAAHPPTERPQVETTQPGHRARVESIRIRHALEPVDAARLAARDETKPANGLLVAGQQMREHVLHRPPVLCARSANLRLGHVRDERERCPTHCDDVTDGLAPPAAE